MKVAVLGYYQLLRNLYMRSLDENGRLTEREIDFSEESLRESGDLIRYCTTEAQLEPGCTGFIKERITHRIENIEYDPKDSIRILQKLDIFQTMTFVSERY